jgi:hypothetical protein
MRLHIDMASTMVLPIVPGATKCPHDDARFPDAVKRLMGLTACTMGLSLATALTATVVALPQRAGAENVSGLKAQAKQIAQALVLEQLQFGADQQQFEVDTAKVQQDVVEIASTQEQIQSDIGKVNSDKTRLQHEAVAAYVNLNPEFTGASGLFENQKEAPTTAEYEYVATGDINLTIDSLHIDETGLRSERATLVQQQAQDETTTKQEATLVDAARQVEAELAAKQSEITGQLIAAVAQQQKAQDAAAAAAVRAAEAKAAAAARGGNSSSGGDPALPPFLQCVLRVESGGNYQAVSPGGTYMGGFQFSQPTWNQAAGLANMPQLVGVPPNVATPSQQDDLAIALYDADGQQPWNDSCRNTT